MFRGIKYIIPLIFLIAQHALGQNLEIHHIDVGQADSTLIIGPSGTTMLIDAGNSGYFSLDDGKIVFEYLESINIFHLDYIIVTHGDGDHVGGFAFYSIPNSVTEGCVKKLFNGALTNSTNHSNLERRLIGSIFNK
jgi:beta-lactamase superfamily II metal-dependent hydrolase